MSRFCQSWPNSEARAGSSPTRSPGLSPWLLLELSPGRTPELSSVASIFFLILRAQQVSVQRCP